MIDFTNSVSIDRPVDDVFAFLADFTNMPLWNYFVLEVRQIDQEPVGMGTVFHQTRKTDSQRFVVTEYQPPRRLAIKTLPPAPALEMRFTLQPDGLATYLVDEWRFDSGRGPVLERLARGKVRSAVSDNLRKLKALLEQGRVTLQDGRVTRYEPQRNQEPAV
jgi:uncharacterized membrane protein